MDQVEQVTPAGVSSGGPAWRPGHRIGSFELQAALHSSGGTGIVYRAWDFALARPVAIKEYFPTALARRRANGEVHPALPGDADAFERGRDAFVSECQVLARCDHPSLVRTLHLVEIHHTVYCVMPWYAGRPLLEVQPKMGGPPPEPFLRALLDDLLGALDAYHQVGPVHGGVSPSKVLLLDDGRALLLGPGAAGRVMPGRSGDAPPQPPESPFPVVERSTRVEGSWTDFHALAVLVRYMITGILPQDGGRGAYGPLAATVERLFVDRPSGHYSVELVRSLDAALSADITRRPQTAAQFRQWLVRGPDEPPRPPAPAPAASQAPSQAPPPVRAPEAGPATPHSPLAAAQGAEAADDEVDSATADAIRRLIDSIPGALDHAPRRAASPMALPGAEPASSKHERDLRPPGTLMQARRRRRQLWAGAAVGGVVGVAIALGMWQLQAPRDRPATAEETLADEALQSTTKAKAPTLDPAPTPPATAPAERSAQVDPPPTAGVAPAAPSLVEETPARAPDAGQGSPPAARQTPRTATEPVVSSPRAQCGARTEFSLYRCMQQQCSLARWRQHPQCVRLKASDSVD